MHLFALKCELAAAVCIYFLWDSSLITCFILSYSAWNIWWIRRFLRWKKEMWTIPSWIAEMKRKKRLISYSCSFNMKNVMEFLFPKLMAWKLKWTFSSWINGMKEYIDIFKKKVIHFFLYINLPGVLAWKLLF